MAGGSRFFGRMPVAAEAATSDTDLEGLARPLLEALATIGDLDSTYLTVFDWDVCEQKVRYLHSTGQVEIADRSRLPLAAAASRQRCWPATSCGA